jgi:hypothetical protein
VVRGGRPASWGWSGTQHIPSRKGKEKVGAPAASTEVPVFDASVPEPPETLLATLTQGMVEGSALLRLPPNVPLVL